jgi:hypothetical protein
MYNSALYEVLRLKNALFAFKFLMRVLALLLASLFLLVSAVVSINLQLQVSMTFLIFSLSLRLLSALLLLMFLELLLNLEPVFLLASLPLMSSLQLLTSFFLFLVFLPWFLAFLLRSCPVAGVPGFTNTGSETEFVTFKEPKNRFQGTNSVRQPYSYSFS